MTPQTYQPLNLRLTCFLKTMGTNQPIMWNHIPERRKPQHWKSYFCKLHIVHLMCHRQSEQDVPSCANIEWQYRIYHSVSLREILLLHDIEMQKISIIALQCKTIDIIFIYHCTKIISSLLPLHILPSMYEKFM